MSEYPRKGAALVLCAPSGTGKTTLAGRLLAKYPRIVFSVSCTTRDPRPGEAHGRDYFFVSTDRFKDLIAQHYFAEWAQVHGQYYGTPLEAAVNTLEDGRDLLFDVDVQGAAQLKSSLPGAYFVFVMPPSREVLKERLHMRASEDPESISLRLDNALWELKQAAWFNAWIINNDQEEAFLDLCAVYQTASLHPMRRPNFLQRLLNEFESSTPDP